MTTLTRMLVCAIVAGGLLATVTALEPEGAAHVGLDFWNLPTLQMQFEKARQHSAALEEANNQVNRRLDLKDEAVKELIEGKTGLRDTVGRFAVFNRQAPNCGQYIEQYYGKRSKNPLCEHVLDWILVRLRTYPSSQAAAVVARLEAEMQRDNDLRAFLPLSSRR